MLGDQCMDDQIGVVALKLSVDLIVVPVEWTTVLSP
jgi:hypothetical protein